jgi:FixJ family two-component response regulator
MRSATLRSADRHPMPIIFVTAFPDESARQRAMSAGAIGFLSKPFDEAVLIECLETALSRSAVQAGTSAI